MEQNEAFRKLCSYFRFRKSIKIKDTTAVAWAGCTCSTIRDVATQPQINVLTIELFICGVGRGQEMFVSVVTAANWMSDVFSYGNLTVLSKFVTDLSEYLIVWWLIDFIWQWAVIFLEHKRKYIYYFCGRTVLTYDVFEMP